MEFTKFLVLTTGICLLVIVSALAKPTHEKDGEAHPGPVPTIRQHQHSSTTASSKRLSSCLTKASSYLPLEVDTRNLTKHDEYVISYVLRRAKCSQARAADSENEGSTKTDADARSRCSRPCDYNIDINTEEGFAEVDRMLHACAEYGDGHCCRCVVNFMAGEYFDAIDYPNCP